MPISNDKVYCRDCAYISSSIHGPDKDLTCNAPENMEQKSNWYELHSIHKDSPEVLNQNNNCPHFKEKNDF